MSFYLSSTLANNRKGRFLQTIAGAIPLDVEWLSSPPVSGLLLLQSEELIDKEAVQILYQWAMQTGCATLIINPEAEQMVGLGQLPTPLDWQLVSTHLSVSDHELTTLLLSETSLALVGFAGSADGQLHIAGDVVHTRYQRKHSNSGLLAVTTLPLWSLSLLDHGDVLVDWLQWFVDHAGVVAPSFTHEDETIDFSLDKNDLVVLLLFYAGNGKDLTELIENDTVRLLFDVKSLDIAERCKALQQHGFLDDMGLTELGKTSLQKSQYWIYAPLLSEQLTTGALLA